MVQSFMVLPLHISMDVPFGPKRNLSRHSAYDSSKISSGQILSVHNGFRVSFTHVRQSQVGMILHLLSQINQVAVSIEFFVALLTELYKPRLDVEFALSYIHSSELVSKELFSLHCPVVVPTSLACSCVMDALHTLRLPEAQILIHNDILAHNGGIDENYYHVRNLSEHIKHHISPTKQWIAYVPNTALSTFPAMSSSMRRIERTRKPLNTRPCQARFDVINLDDTVRRRGRYRTACSNCHKAKHKCDKRSAMACRRCTRRGERCDGIPPIFSPPLPHTSATNRMSTLVDRYSKTDYEIGQASWNNRHRDAPSKYGQASSYHMDGPVTVFSDFTTLSEASVTMHQWINITTQVCLFVVLYAMQISLDLCRCTPVCRQHVSLKLERALTLQASPSQ